MNRVAYRLNDKLGFGRHQNDTIRQVIDGDPDYIVWALNTLNTFELDDEAIRYLGVHFWQAS